MNNTEIILTQLQEMGYKISKSSDNKHFFKHSELVLELCYNDNDTLIISINRDLDNYINHHIDTNKDFFNYICEQAYLSTIRKENHVKIIFEYDYYELEYRYKMFSFDNLEATLTHMIEELTNAYYNFHKELSIEILDYKKNEEDSEDDGESKSENDNDSSDELIEKNHDSYNPCIFIFDEIKKISEDEIKRKLDPIKEIIDKHNYMMSKDNEGEFFRYQLNNVYLKYDPLHSSPILRINFGKTKPRYKVEDEDELIDYYYIKDRESVIENCNYINSHTPLVKFFIDNDSQMHEEEFDIIAATIEINDFSEEGFMRRLNLLIKAIADYKMLSAVGMDIFS